MTPGMRAGLEDVGWAGLRHNYGTAEDVPGLLRRCAGTDRADVDTAAFDLENVLFHQGGWICPAAPAARAAGLLARGARRATRRPPSRRSCTPYGTCPRERTSP